MVYVTGRKLFSHLFHECYSVTNNSRASEASMLFLEEGAGRRGSLLVRHNRVSGRFASKNRLYPLKTAESDFRRRANQNKGASLTPRIKNHNREESRKRLLEPRSQKGLTVVYVYFSSGEFPFKV